MKLVDVMAAEWDDVKVFYLGCESADLWVELMVFVKAALLDEQKVDLMGKSIFACLGEHWVDYSEYDGDA